MSDVKLPPQTSPTDTSNWDNKVFTTPVINSVGKVKKSVERREMIPNGPKSASPKQRKNPDIVRINKRKIY